MVQPVKGEAAEEALLFAHVVVHANVESLRGCGIQTRKQKLFKCRSGLNPKWRIGIVALGKWIELLRDWIEGEVNTGGRVDIAGKYVVPGNSCRVPARG